MKPKTTGLKLAFLIFAFLALASCRSSGPSGDDVAATGLTFLDDTTITFASQADGAAILGVSDEFTVGLSSVDVAARMSDAAMTTEEDYLTVAAEQAQPWTTAEIEQTVRAVQSTQDKITDVGLNPPLPSEIVLVKSTMGEEGGASGYTRGNVMVLGGPPDTRLFAHELFHILSRNGSDIQDDLYATIDFQPTNRVEFPPSFNELKITNPDAPFVDHYLTTDIDGTPTDVAFVLRASQQFNGGTFNTYVKKWLAVLDGPDTAKQPLLVDGNPVLLPYEDAPNLQTSIGDNTFYDIHPEEVLAEHFSLLLHDEDVPSPSLLEALAEVLRK